MPAGRGTSAVGSSSKPSRNLFGRNTSLKPDIDGLPSSPEDENAGIRETLRALIVKESFVDENKLVEDATLESLSIDSLDMSMIMMAIEEKFDIYLSVDTELDGIVTFGELVALLEKKVSQGIAEQPAK